MTGDGPLQLRWRPYCFALPRTLITSRGALLQRSGWLLQLSGPQGSRGWGEAAAPLLAAPNPAVADALAELPACAERSWLEQRLPLLPLPLACALGMALAELDGLGSAGAGGWRSAPVSAALLPAGEAALPALEALLREAVDRPAQPLTLKWKVAACAPELELELLETLLQRLPVSARLRLDANGGWDRATADQWAKRLVGEPRLEWLEQPLPASDQEGLAVLAARLPVALDESLPGLSAVERAAWPGWLVRRPLQEGDPRPLLEALQAGASRQMISTAFETGIGRRFVEHLAALQADGPTPTAPGLAPGWRPTGALFSGDPEQVWEAVA